MDCENETDTLHVHHLFYLPDREPWEYSVHELVTLCQRCHEARETAMLALKRSLRYQGALDIQAVADAASWAVGLSDALREFLEEMAEERRNRTGK